MPNPKVNGLQFTPSRLSLKRLRIHSATEAQTLGSVKQNQLTHGRQITPSRNLNVAESYLFLLGDLHPGSVIQHLYRSQPRGAGTPSASIVLPRQKYTQPSPDQGSQGPGIWLSMVHLLAGFRFMFNHRVSSFSLFSSFLLGHSRDLSPLRPCQARYGRERAIAGLPGLVSFPFGLC